MFPVILEIHLKTNNMINVNHQLDIDKVLNNIQIRQWLLYVVIASIVVICAYESILGVFQLIGCRPSNHYLYAITGSFDNPGPYGGFLAICVSVIGAYVINNKPQADTSLF